MARDALIEALSREPALESPPEMRLLGALNTVASGYGLGRLGGSLAGALGQKAAVLPETLKGIPKGSKVGDPHALYAYHDDFGPGMTRRAIYNVFGDPAHPAIQKAGWGSSVPEEMLKKLGIPITGRQL